MASVWAELKQRNVVRVAVAYAIAAWLLIEITATTFPILKLPEWTVTLVTVLVLIGFPLALILAWAFELTPEGIKKEKDVDRSESSTHVAGRKLDFAIIGVLAIAVVYFVAEKFFGADDLATESQVNASIAVLPFANMSTNEETGFFADGLSEDILDNLAQIERIKVASRSDSFQFTDRGEDSSIIGEKLKVAYLLEGSVRQQGDNVRITAQLIRTEDGFHVWSKSYERTLADGFEMQSSVAINIAYITESKLNFDVFKNYGWKAQGRFDGIDPIAVQHYINAQDEYNNIHLGEGGDWESIVQFLKNAVKVDSNFYRAYSLLANAYFQLHRIGRLSLQEARPAAHAAITNAIALAADDRDARLQLARIHLYLDLDYASAEVEFIHYLTKFPKHGWSHFNLADIALREGRTSEALRQMAMASAYNAGTDQASFVAATAWIPCIGGDYEGALKATTQGLKLALGGQDRARILRLHAISLVWSGRVEEAKPFIEEGWHLERNTSPELYIALFAYIGDIEKSKNILTDSRFDLVDHYGLAMGYLALGDIDNTFNSIQAGVENYNPSLIESLIVAEWWNPIRDDPRFDDMLALLDSKVTHTQTYLNNLDPTGGR